MGVLNVSDRWQRAQAPISVPNVEKYMYNAVLSGAWGMEGCLRRCFTCRMASHMGKRVGGQGLVVFAQHSISPQRQFAIKFFLSPDAFEIEREAACNLVRLPASPHRDVGELL